VTSPLPQDDLDAVFAAVPVSLLVLNPELQMVHANASYLRDVGHTLDELRGRYVADVFPDAPDRHGVNQLEILYGFMRSTIASRRPRTLSGFRYDIPNRTGGFDVRHWNVTETPLLDADGAVRLLLHYTEDITALVVERDARESAAAANEALQQQVLAAQLDLQRRADELEILNERLLRAGERDRGVAETLQKALLTDLPSVDELQLSVRYRTAAEHDQVGGDWYDALQLDNGVTALVIGDVAGHDINAAAKMGQVRSMLRAFAWEYGQPPSIILGQLDRAMRDLQVRTSASVVLANLEQFPDDAVSGSRTMTWSNAGHPPPIMLTADGVATVLETAGCYDPLLGVLPDSDRVDHVVQVPPGATVVFYTDGLVDRRDSDIDAGLSLLQQAVTRHRLLSPAAMLDAVLDDLVGVSHEDDIAVLAIRNNAAAHDFLVVPSS
jgi:serine phosphatase RsbU (regulator of sigma subunit)